jgi:MFS family permease
VGYLQLLRENSNFRNLYISRLISLFGDWVNLIAIFTLIKELIGPSPIATSIVLVLKFLPNTLLSPIAGIFADRYDRKTILVWSDITRFLVVCCFLLVPIFPNIWFIYTLIFLQTALGTFFEPARTAMMPDLVPGKALVTANALGGIAWALMLTFGSAAGGILTELFGWQVNITIDAVSYLISAIFIFRIQYTPTYKPITSQKRSGWSENKELYARLFADPRLFHLSILKGAYSIGGAASLMLTMYGQEIFPSGTTGAMSLSALLVARGLGATLGPVIGRWYAQSDTIKLQKVVLFSLIIFGFFYTILSVTNNLFLACLVVFFAHMGGSSLWAFSTVLLQIEAAPDIRGRIFGFEFGLATLSSSIATLFFGYLIDIDVLTIRQASAAMGISLALPISLWLYALRHHFRE